MARQQNQQPTTTAPAVTNNNLTILNRLLVDHKDQIATALPRHMTPERMIRVALTAASRTPELAQCTPISIAGCIIQASILGLEPASVLGEAYLIPFWNKTVQPWVRECQLIPGYMGLLKLARNSGEVSMFDAQIVYRNDFFEFEKGANTTWSHKWARSGPRGEYDGAWAGYVLKDGNRNFEYWTIEQICDHRDRYSQGAYKRGADGKEELTGAWAESEEWMYKKTVIRQTTKLMPKSVEMATALKLAEMGEVSLPQALDVEPLVEQLLTPAKDTEGGPQRRSDADKTTAPKAETKTADTDTKKPQGETEPAKTETKTTQSATVKTDAPVNGKDKPRPATISDIFAIVKEIGEEAWFDVLGKSGYENPQQIATQEAAAAVLQAMKDRVK